MQSWGLPPAALLLLAGAWLTCLSGRPPACLPAAEKGTLIRVFSTGDGTKLQEVRRGSDPACIYSIAFSR